METQQSTIDHCHTVTCEAASSPSKKYSALQHIFQKHIWTISTTLAFFYLIASIAFPICLIVPISGQIKGLSEVCGPDGDFDWDAWEFDPGWYYRPYEAGYYYKSFLNLFSRPSLVTVTIAFGSYTFAQAKWIDLVWDIGVGRIGQVILVYISSRVITRSMLYAMEAHPIPHHLFVGISFQNHSSMKALWSVLTVTPKHYLWKVWKGRLLIIALIMSYLIAFPTIITVMTGYITTFTTKIELGDMAIDALSPNLGYLWYTIGNCSVFNWDGECHFVAANFDFVWKIAETGNIYDSATFNSLSNKYECQIDLDNSNTCGTLQINGTNHTIDPLDSLDISFPQDISFYYNGAVYAMDDVSKNGQCVPGKEYSWGFSYQLLFLFSLLNLLWTISIWSLWLMAKGEYGVETSYGLYRAAVDLTTIAKDTLDRPDDPVDEMSNMEIEKGLEHRYIGIVRPDDNSLQLSPKDSREKYKEKHSFRDRGIWPVFRKRRTEGRDVQFTTVQGETN